MFKIFSQKYELFNKSSFGKKIMNIVFIKFSGKAVSDFRYTITNWKAITETLLKIARCWMRSVKGLAILACNFLHATQVAAIFIA